MNASLTNCSEGNCRKCFDLGVYDVGEIQTSVHLLRYAAAHCIIVTLLGTLCNAVALWCIVTCTRTRPAVKVLLCSVFLPILVICLVTRPAMAAMVLSVLACDPDKTPKVLRLVFTLLYSALAEMELFCIAAVSFFRAVAVWSPQRHMMKLRVAVAVVASISFYSVLTAVGWLGTLYLGVLGEKAVMRGMKALFFLLNTAVPVLVTMTCYVAMMVAVQQNKRRLAGIQDKGSGGASVVDQATLAMLAVFVSNLVFSLPHSIYHILEKQSQTSHIIFHVLFSTHFVVDPVVFVWFNRNYRQRVGERMRAGLEWMTRCCSSPSPRTASTFHLHLSSTSSNDQESSLNKQAEPGKMVDCSNII